MGHHIDAQGRFQSDKFPGLPPDVVGIKIKPETAEFLWRLADLYESADPEFATDLKVRLTALAVSLGGAAP